MQSRQVKAGLRHFATACLLATMLASCSKTTYSALSEQLKVSNCNQRSVYSYKPHELPRPLHDMSIDPEIAELFTTNVLNTVNAAGLLNTVKEYTNSVKLMRQDHTVEHRLKVLELAQQIDRKINIADLEISAIASEVDCEKERASQLASHLKSKEDNSSSNLTVAAIVVGATGAITAGVLLAKDTGTNTAEIVGIGTGITEATLGMMILLNTRRVEFYHERNILREIWYGPEVSSIFPAPIWYYLNYQFPDRDEPSRRLQIVEQWRTLEQVAGASEKEKKEMYELFFGEGGKYTSEQLAKRADMYEHIEAQINLMMQDLKELSVQLERIGRM